MSQTSVTNEQWARIFANAWLDESFAHLLRTDPTAAVRQFLNIPAGTHIDIFLVPPKPADLSDEQIQAVAEGRGIIVPAYCC
ncbi:MAG TPA: hypothetical protein VKB79_26345 [Bryobacteraceae bacterium]|nr:hypothetical protein [Bryobacteraceae bacterium]